MAALGFGPFCDLAVAIASRGGLVKQKNDLKILNKYEKKKNKMYLPFHIELKIKIFLSSL